MFGFAWLAIRQAREALKQGRLEEAHRLLTQPAIRDHRAIGDLLAQLTRGYVEHGERQLQLDDAEGAWRDLLQAEQLQTAEKGVDRLRQTLTRLGLAEVRAVLHTGETRRADEVIARLRERRVRSAELQVLEEATRDWLQARELAGHGEFALALEAVERVRRRLHDRPAVLEKFAVDVQKHRDSFGGLLAHLHEAADAGRWREVLERAEQVLAIAPQHGEARKARSRAWKAIEPVTVAMPSPISATNGDTLACEGLPTRFLLWIDGVGGYLVCLGARLTFGQAILDAHVDIPLVADVSRLHASVTRDTEGYVLEAMRPIQVNAREVTRTLLQSGDRVTLGASCQLQFHLPVPISTTARLDLVSGHRLPLSVDAILLMADTLVLGEGPQVHITVPDLKQPLVLFRQKDTLGIRHSGKLSINGHKSGERLLLGDPHATVSGENISFAIEPVGARLG
ncbi:MAG TPA: FHA domain-containing protein [Gemmataceae bacterium]|nr:FHA domain-containing protein [Gemmataceae bacterium]